jgi:holdfast attachment protein HfaA
MAARFAPSLGLLAAAAALILTGFQPAEAQSVRRSSGDGADLMNRPYATSPGEENRPMSGSTRDANGNRVIVNGQYVSNGVLQSRDGLTGGVGRAGTGASGNATAIGNSLNVIVTGRYNTVIVDADQINNGNQTAVLNGGLNLDQ